MRMTSIFASAAAMFGLASPDADAFQPMPIRSSRGLPRRGQSSIGRLRHNRYRPHQGKVEIARRKRQIEAGQLTAANGLRHPSTKET